MEQQIDESAPKKQAHTLQSLIDTIQFSKPRKKKKKALSETSSISSSHTIDSDIKQKSKMWSYEETMTLEMKLKQFGTDFHILSTFFPKKTKNQIKNKYKQLMALRKKESKEQKSKLQAIAKMFSSIQQRQEQN